MTFGIAIGDPATIVVFFPDGSRPCPRAAPFFMRLWEHPASRVPYEVVLREKRVSNGRRD